jgi:type IV secretory pathway ATPase VirB11/archaellum biosynthesis ATPase
MKKVGTTSNGKTVPMSAILKEFGDRKPISVIVEDTIEFKVAK